MEATGKEHSPARAGTLVAAIDGVLLRAVREDPEDRARFLRDSLELLMTALVGKSTQPHLLERVLGWPVPRGARAPLTHTTQETTCPRQ